MKLFPEYSDKMVRRIIRTIFQNKPTAIWYLKQTQEARVHILKTYLRGEPNKKILTQIYQSMGVKPTEG